jgi:hypothetical protein
MAIEIKFTATRPDISEEFWWESTDPSIVSQQTRIDEIADGLGITRTFSISSDKLTSESTYVSPTLELWDDFRVQTSDAFPNFNTERQNYFRSRNHTLFVRSINLESGIVLTERFIVS